MPFYAGFVERKIIQVNTILILVFRLLWFAPKLMYKLAIVKIKRLLCIYFDQIIPLLHYDHT